ncbi:TetR/AcrR family transcriptional regulator [Sporichthya polymorpha]|uniref:TetR/AcrR family transcriptional regulator n=1 Tax=Sporichthya polymorpha TaxID=35751 RepID=UPI00036969C0|nr:TetR/AcrR family transcriptional regulator [Sporichthya polymorpha]
MLAAVENLAADGVSYSTVTVERLAMAAGISRATFYIYFESKADLAEAWLAETLKEIARAAVGWEELDAAPSPERLTLVVGDLIDAYTAHAALLVAVQAEATQHPLLRRRLAEASDIAVDSIRDHIAAGQAAGWVDRDLPALETAAWLYWMFERGLRQLVTGANVQRKRALRDNLASILWHVLYGPPVPAGGSA